MAIDPSLREQLRAGLAQQKKAADYAKDPGMWAKEKLGVHLWSKQREICDSVRDNKRTVVASCHGSGKALTLDTPLRKPDDSYVTMGEVRVGDWLLDEQYRPTQVVAVTPVEERKTLEVYFTSTENASPTTDMGTASSITTSITTSYEHEWAVLTTQERSRITVLCQRHNIKRPDWSYWAHRTTIMESMGIARVMSRFSGRSIDRPMVPAARHMQTAHSYGIDLATYGNAHIDGFFERYGTVDEQGRLCLRVSAKLRPEQFSRAGRKIIEPPENITKARCWLEGAGHKTLLTKERHGYSMTFTLSITSDPRPVLAEFTPSGDKELSTDDIQALVLNAWDERNGIKPMGGWLLARVDHGRPQRVKCVEVDGPSHLYLAGRNDVPTHNSMIASVIAAWWVDSHPPGTAIVVSTAPTYSQVHAILWEEIRKHHNTAKNRGNPLPGTITMADNWNLPGGQLVGFGRKPKDGDRHAFQGIHRRYVLAILDEACGVPEELWTGAEAITTNEGCRILAIGNPDDRDTEFGKNYCDPATAQDWNRISIPAHSTPNLTGEPVPPLLNEVLVSKAWCDERLRAWGADDPRYISKVLAKFPEANAASLFSPVVIATAFEQSGRKREHPASTLYFGVDVARYGGDLNVLTMFDGVRAQVLDSWGGTDTVSSAVRVLTRVAEEVKDHKATAADIRVDAVGLGAGVVDTLAARRADLEQELIGTGYEPWFTVREMHGSAAAPKDVGGSVQGYGNARAWWYDQLKHLMRSGTIEIAEHAKLQDELGGIRYEYRNGKLYIESKEEIRKRNGKSPDYADSLVYATAPVHEGLSPGDTVSEDAYTLAVAEFDLEAEMMRDIRISPY
jgi:hypothetical protein